MARASAKIKSKVKRKPVKAGSKPRPHGGFPTQAVIKLTSEIKKKNR